MCYLTGHMVMIQQYKCSVANDETGNVLSKQLSNLCFREENTCGERKS